MKAIKINLLLAILTAFLTVGSCEIFSDEEADKECQENEIKTPDYREIYINYAVYGPLTPAAGHNILEAIDLTFTGNLRRMNCRDDEAEYYPIDWTAHPIIEATSKVSYNFRVCVIGTCFAGLKFYNNAEYVSVAFTMKVKFADGKVFKSSETIATTNHVKYWASNTQYTMNMNQTVNWTASTK
jgi:hypothetical protein